MPLLQKPECIIIDTNGPSFIHVTIDKIFMGDTYFETKRQVFQEHVFRSRQTDEKRSDLYVHLLYNGGQLSYQCSQRSEPVRTLFCEGNRSFLYSKQRQRAFYFAARNIDQAGERALALRTNSLYQTYQSGG